MHWSELRLRCLPPAQPQVVPPEIKLPVLPTVVMQFAKLADDPDAAPKDLGQLIETDSTLTCELLRYANSAAFAARNKLSTAQQAIARIGIRAAKMFLLSAGVQQTIRASKSKLINIQNFWLTNLERALLAREIARKLRADADLAYSASLLQDFLLPVLGNELFDTYFPYLQQPEGSRTALIQWEQNRHGWDHPLATAQVLHAWGFPDDLVCCVRLHHEGLRALESPEFGKTAVAAVAIAALIPDPLRQTPDGFEQLLSLDGIWPQFHLAELASTVADELKEITPLAGQHATLSRRLEKHLAAATS
jgi:HD-like signal output (HDOD) protein